MTPKDSTEIKMSCQEHKGGRLAQFVRYSMDHIWTVVEVGGATIEI